MDESRAQLAPTEDYMCRADESRAQLAPTEDYMCRDR